MNVAAPANPALRRGIEVTEQKIGGESGKEVVRHDEAVEGHRERRDKVKHVGRVENAGLERGQKGNPRVVVGVPQGKAERLRLLHPQEPWRNKIDAQVSFDENGACREDGIEIGERQNDEEQDRKKRHGNLLDVEQAVRAPQRGEQGRRKSRGGRLLLRPDKPQTATAATITSMIAKAASSIPAKRPRLMKRLYPCPFHRLPRPRQCPFRPCPLTLFESFILSISPIPSKKDGHAIAWRGES